MAAVWPSCSGPATSWAASAVDGVATVTAPGSSRCRNDRHWAVATGIDRTRRTSPSATPLGANRFIWTPITTSRWMSSSVSNANASTVTVTPPSIEFSMPTKPRSTSSFSTALSTSGIDGRATSSCPARSDCDTRACSVKVPSGPRKPMRSAGSGSQDDMRGIVSTSAPWPRSGSGVRSDVRVGKPRTRRSPDPEGAWPVFDGFEEFDIATTGTTIHGRRGGEGPPVLLLHGIPETHLMWHLVAPHVDERFTVVVTDLRGFGASGTPPSTPDPGPYSMREVARDQVEVMNALVYEEFGVAGHDRGARCAYRMALDHPAAVSHLAVLDIVPPGEAYARADRDFSLGYWVWW